MAYPPPELNIRGSSGPTWVVVSNLVLGTSVEDVRLTFGTFGKVEDVKQRSSPSAASSTVGFEVAFSQRQDAQTAVDKFNGALADGRILSVTIKKPDVARDPKSQFERATAQAVAQRPRGHNLIQAPGPVPYTPAPAAAAAIPTAPASLKSRARAAELIEPRARKSNAASTPNNKASQQLGAAKTTATLAQRVTPLANRLLTPAQAQKQQAEEAAKKAKADAKAKALAATGKTTVLGKRLGGLPLAQRLLQQDAGTTPKSDTTAIKLAAEKKKRKRDAAKAKKAGKTGSTGMDLDA